VSSILLTAQIPIAIPYIPAAAVPEVQYSEDGIIVIIVIFKRGRGSHVHQRAEVDGYPKL
jgi:hypothetical protein